jgi:hypothetical protein
VIAPRSRRLIVRLALIFAVAQAVAVAGVLLTLPPMQERPVVPPLVLTLLAVDLGLLVVLSGWIIQGSVSSPLDRLAADVQRIADGDYRHRIGDLRRAELEEIRESVNRLADRLITDQRLLAGNIESLDETNRQLRAARDQVVRSARLASVGTLAAGIAHEVGNPLGAILGFVDVAKARVQREGGDTELLDSIRSEAKRIDRIVRGLLDFARPSTVESGAAPAAVVVERVRDVLDSQGRLEDVAHAWSVEADSRVLEPHRLEQVLINLMLNALHAVRHVAEPRVEVRVTEEAGQILGMPRRREGDPPGVNYMHRRREARDEAGVGSVAGAERMTVITVSDNGHGIPEGVAERLFDPFFTTKDPGEGTGLGLAICARLVEGMGGSIEHQGVPTGGACFVIRLPVVYDTGEEFDASDPGAVTTESP